MNKYYAIFQSEGLKTPVICSGYMKLKDAKDHIKEMVQRGYREISDKEEIPDNPDDNVSGLDLTHFIQA